jgi:hypothetical protein
MNVSFFNRSLHYLNEEKNLYKKRERELLNISPLNEIYLNESLSKGECEGDVILKRIFKNLKELDKKWERTIQQVEFHNAFISALLPKLYGQSIFQHYNRLCREYKLGGLNPNILILAPRRIGKTMAVALFITAFLLSKPNAIVTIYSTGQRLSMNLLNLVKEMAGFLIDSGRITGVKEVLNINTEYGLSTLYSYPANEKISQYFIFFFFFFLFFFFLLYQDILCLLYIFFWNIYTHIHTNLLFFLRVRKNNK